MLTKLIQTAAVIRSETWRKKVETLNPFTKNCLTSFSYFFYFIHQDVFQTFSATAAEEEPGSFVVHTIEKKSRYFIVKLRKSEQKA